MGGSLSRNTPTNGATHLFTKATIALYARVIASVKVRKCYFNFKPHKYDTVNNVFIL